eukprot:2180686-Amphidinium_carterae.1
MRTTAPVPAGSATIKCLPCNCKRHFPYKWKAQGPSKEPKQLREVICRQTRVQSSQGVYRLRV